MDFGQRKKKLDGLPASHADDVQQPCDWCGRIIPHEHPPGALWLQAGDLFESRHWRICDKCLDLVIELVKFRAAGTTVGSTEETE